jgi:hypothetical protein
MNPSSDKVAGAPRPRRFRKFVLISLLVLLLAGFIYYLICGITYSEGTRSGILTKVSKKGFVFKTYEGEMSIGGMTGGEGTMIPANNFAFSVIDKKVYEDLEKAQGRKVIVHYKQVIKNFFWQGDTDYFIYKVEVEVNS